MTYLFQSKAAGDILMLGARRPRPHQAGRPAGGHPGDRGDDHAR